MPLIRHENENARKIADLEADFITDPAEMPPAVARYFREREEWLTPEVCERWGMGYLPRDGRSMLRGWIVYAHRNEEGEVLTYSGRDAGFAEKHAKWIRNGRPEKQKPLKHKYVKGYQRGLELYGQQHGRLQDTEFKRSLKDRGLVVVEGMNDVIRLDTLGIAAIGLCSNKATDEQVAKIVRYAERAAKGRVTLLPDRDQEGVAGFQPLAWKLMQSGLDVRLGWRDSNIDGIQPESADVSTLRL